MKSSTQAAFLASTLFLATLISTVGSDFNKTLAQGRAVAIVVEGTVLVKRSGASSYSPLFSGTLYAGDLVMVESGSSGVVRCTANEITRTLPDDGIPQGITDICP